MRILLVRGVEDALYQHGMEHFADDFDMVVKLQHDEKVVNRWGEAHEIDYLDVDPPEQVMVECMERIKVEWEQTHPDVAHLGHSAAGMWWFYWYSPDMEQMPKLLADGRREDLRAAAADYIAAGFGEDRGPTLNVPEMVE